MQVPVIGLKQRLQALPHMLAWLWQLCITCNHGLTGAGDLLLKTSFMGGELVPGSVRVEGVQAGGPGHDQP